MAMYALAVTPLVQALRHCQPDILQVWYADDATAAGNLQSLFQYRKHILYLGPRYGYFPKATKTCIIVKPEFLESTRAIFQGSGVQVTANGQHHLGAAIGSRCFAEEYVAEKIKLWSEEIRVLSRFAQMHPHSAYTAFTHGVVHKWIFLMQTVQCISHLFQPLEDVIHQFLIPAMSGRNPCSELEREVLSLPCRLGGMNIPNPTKYSDSQYSGSRQISASLASLIEQQSNDFCILNLQSAKSDIHWLKRQHLSSVADSVKSRLDPLLQRIVGLNSMKCSFLWLTALPIQEQGFRLNNQEFWDALNLRFGWQLYDVSIHCVCGTPFSVDHAMVCRHGDLTFIQLDSWMVTRGLL